MIGRRLYIGVMLVAVTSTACGASDNGPLSDSAVPADAYTSPLGEVRSSRPYVDELGAHRDLVVGVPGAVGSAALAALADATALSGQWRKTACNTRYERCFENGEWFLAMVARADLDRKDAPTSYDGKGGKDTPDEVLVGIERHVGG